MNGKNLIRCDVRAWNMVESMSRWWCCRCWMPVFVIRSHQHVWFVHKYVSRGICSKCSISHHKNVAANSRCPFTLSMWTLLVCFSHTCITIQRIESDCQKQQQHQKKNICIYARNEYIRLWSVNIVKWLTNYRQWSWWSSSPSSSQHKYAYHSECLFFSVCLSFPFLISSFSARNELAGKKLAELVWLCVLTFWSWLKRKKKKEMERKKWSFYHWNSIQFDCRIALSSFLLRDR